MVKQSMDSRWNEIHSTVEWGQYPTESVIRFIARNYYNKDRKSIKILDIYQILKGGGEKTPISGFGYATTGYGIGRKIETGTFEGITDGNLAGVGRIHFTTKDELYQTLGKCGFHKCKVDDIRYTDQGNDIEQLIAYGEKCHV